MAIGINDFDDIDNDDLFTQEEPGTTPDNDNQDPPQDGDDGSQQEPANQPEEDFISVLLKSRGIEDKSKIKFENDEGSVEEVDWDSLSNEDRLNILSSSTTNPETDLEASEIQLINAIRQSKMTPAEYIQYIEQTGVDRYVQNAQQENQIYKVDQYSDDELFVMDFMSRTDATEDEAKEALANAKANQALFDKQIGAIRNDYKKAEEETLHQEQLEQEQIAQEQYNQFSQAIADQINGFTDFNGCDINMDEEDMQELYEFITGFDAAGNNHFAKVLNDPQLVVQMAWFALNGKQMIDDINEYYQKEITNVRKESYAKGLEDGKQKSTDVVFKQKSKPNPKNQEVYSDLDDF